VSALVAGEKTQGTPQGPLGRGFGLLFAGAVTSRFGDANRIVALALLAATLSRDPRMVSLIAVMTFLPWLLFGLIAGALVDRMDRRRAFLASDLGRAAIATLLCAAVLSGRAGLWMLAAAAFALGTLQTISDSCFTAMLPQVVPRARLPRANARLSAAQSAIGRLAGSPAGSALFAVRSALPFAVDAASFAVAAGCVAATRVERLPRSPQPRSLRGLLTDVGEGMRHLWRATRIRTLVITVAAMNAASGALQAVLPLFALYVLRVPIGRYGWLSATTAAAMIAGNLLAGRMQRSLDGLAVASAAVTVQVLGFAAIAAAHSELLLFVGLGVNGFTAGLWNVPSTSVLMAETAPAFMGRVSSAYSTIALGAAPLGALVGGGAAAAFGFRAVFGGGAVIVAVAAAGLILLNRPSLLRAARGDAATGSSGSPR
jgi:MFS family permease